MCSFLSVQPEVLCSIPLLCSVLQRERKGAVTVMVESLSICVHDFVANILFFHLPSLAEEFP